MEKNRLQQITVKKDVLLIAKDKWMAAKVCSNILLKCKALHLSFFGNKILSFFLLKTKDFYFIYATSTVL
jgi:hypothetical protein